MNIDYEEVLMKIKHLIDNSANYQLRKVLKTFLYDFNMFISDRKDDFKDKEYNKKHNKESNKEGSKEYDEVLILYKAFIFRNVIEIISTYDMNCDNDEEISQKLSCYAKDIAKY